MNNRRLIILATVGLALTLGIVICIAIKPVAAVGLAPVLYAAARIIRVIAEGSNSDSTPPMPPTEEAEEAEEAEEDPAA